ncbi:hypothetical protein FGB62_3g010 [Gracilaria domingensis]|nr:hypothetical protein FGB62_3g010 [Gracilaria domingensis]
MKAARPARDKALDGAPSAWARLHAFLRVFQRDAVLPRARVAARVVPEEPDEKAVDSPVHRHERLCEPVARRGRELPLRDERADLGPVPVILAAGRLGEADVRQHGAHVVEGVRRAVSALAGQQLVVLRAPAVLVLARANGHAVAALLAHRVHKVVEAAAAGRAVNVLHLLGAHGVAVLVHAGVVLELALALGIVQVVDGGAVVEVAVERVERLELAAGAQAHGELDLLAGDAHAKVALLAVARVDAGPGARAAPKRRKRQRRRTQKRRAHLVHSLAPPQSESAPSCEARRGARGGA